MDTTHESLATSRSHSDHRSTRNLSRVIRRALHQPQSRAENHDTIVTSRTLGNRIQSYLIRPFTRPNTKDRCSAQSRLRQTQGHILHSHHDGDLAIQERPPVGSEGELCPNGSVPLHRLCNRCRRFWNVFTDESTWFENPSEEGEFKDWRRLESCTLADLRNDQKFCHFCAIVYSILRDNDSLSPYCSIAFGLGPGMKVWIDDVGEIRGIKIIHCSCQWHPAVQLYSNVIANLPLGRPDDPFNAPFVAQHIPRQPEDNLIQVQRWLDACTSKHPRCNSWCSRLETKGHRPTRVLELNDTGIRLRCDVQAIYDFKYLALSHMWGNDASKQLRLMSSRLQDFQEAIPLDVLPNIFAKAIRITRYLGFKYLWIDSLCIIQDSQSDWTAEANMMSAVYNNAVCTIAFVLPPDVSYDSTQFREDPRVSTPCVIREPVPLKHGMIVTLDRAAQTTESLHRGWPLSSRAWTLQEQILSPRTVFWGDHSIKWECVETFCDELVGDGDLMGVSKDNSEDLTLRELLSPRFSSEPNETRRRTGQTNEYNAISNWNRLINDYRRRDLTHASDRIMAFAGIAQAFQAEHGLVYLAGMWKEQLPRSLLWFIDDPANSVQSLSLTPHPSAMMKGLTCSDPILDSAPTWSFFASAIYSNRLDRHIHLTHGQQSAFGLEYVLFSATLLHFAWPNAPVDYSPPTAYYDFVGLQISLKLITVDVPLPLPKDEELYVRMLRCKSLEAQLGSLFKTGGDSKKVCLFFDDNGKIDQIPTPIRIAIIEERWREYQGKYNFEGLILGPGAEEDTWKRLGYCYGAAESDLSYTTIAEKPLPESRTSMSGESSLFLRLEGAKMETLTLV
ncbi:hypothetical protein IG631_23252 [Alternaria alternata]|nr:hypothetical protein IG631_23252 [Alternaria alternata]